MTRTDSVVTAVDVRNQNGQAMGRKGRLTRRRLIEATVGLLATTRLRDLRVADIAREAGTSSATFYVYFPEVSDVVLAALEELTQSGPEILSLVEGDWADGDPVARASAIVRHYLENWADHNALFRVRNLAADEGDGSFVNARATAIMDLLKATERSVARARDAGWIAPDLDPFTTAGVLMAMLERLAAIQYHYSNLSQERDRMIVSAAHMLAQMMGPPLKRD